LADLSITVSNQLNVFGAAPSDKWGAFNWNAFTWGDGTADLGVHVVKLISETLTPDSAMGGFSVVMLVSDSLTPTSEMTSETLRDAAGYSYVFPDRTTDAENRDFVTWTAGSTGTVTWTASSTTSTSWSTR
jgi:hypothetical protein